ncbi:glutathione S-transferase C-terminal domain-containing protein homolog [Pectinophora gossypiella]|uniref:glutathione S-transferase C-terminal domain-containing protein homolog n=1 Tax=Pectinophora gossypiella TaxID=13191 RepID=UPI00214E4F49|nr:glutathione S-transferase C-terminal domain-containing protein homolog [Pectinophora gossypiella]
MANTVYLEVYTTYEDYLKSSTVELPLVSFITYSIYKYCSPEEVILKFVPVMKLAKDSLKLNCTDDILFENASNLLWQVSSCVYPVVLYDDTVITGLCAVARHISKYRSSIRSPHEHEEGLLGFRKTCLQAPNEVSTWTKLCEVDVIKTVKEVLSMNELHEVPENIVRFENHLSKPVRVHNVYKIARDIKKETLKAKNKNEEVVIKEMSEATAKKTRVRKTRKWKSKAKKELLIDSSTKIEDLDLSHQFAEGPFLTLADIVLLPSYYILIQSLGESIFDTQLPLTYKWYKNIMDIPEVKVLSKVLNGLQCKPLLIQDVVVPCAPKIHNPKKRLFTKEEDIENALSTLMDGMALEVISNEFENRINWSEIPDGANPSAGHLPDERQARKSWQLENLALAVLEIAKEEDLIVDFCSGSGHLGILIAYLLPKCTILLLENKEQSLLRARKRVHDMGLKNVYFFQCNLDFFIGKFDIGIALHACGIASDLVLDKCLKANAKFVLCPCCYGSLHATDRLAYPRSNLFKNISIDQYLCIGHAADQTHEEHPLTVRGAKCMAIIDSDRGRLAEEFGYKVTLSRLKPLSCTPKNNLLVGIPS